MQIQRNVNSFMVVNVLSYDILLFNFINELSYFETIVMYYCQLRFNFLIDKEKAHMTLNKLK